MKKVLIIVCVLLGLGVGAAFADTFVDYSTSSQMYNDQKLSNDYIGLMLNKNTNFLNVSGEMKSYGSQAFTFDNVTTAGAYGGVTMDSIQYVKLLDTIKSQNTDLSHIVSFLLGGLTGLGFVLAYNTKVF